MNWYYSLAADGTTTLVNAAAGSTGPASNVTDLDFSADGLYLYNLLRGTGAVSGYRVEANGSLTALGTFGAGAGALVPSEGPAGLAAY